jgi:hypothetical protein
MKVSTENFSKLVNSKLGDSRPLVKEDNTFDTSRVKRNAIGMYEIEKNKIERALYDLEDSIKKGDDDTASHILMVIRVTLKRMDSFIQEMK